MIKRCNTCLENKDLPSFSKDSSSKDGLTYVCKVCKNRSDKEYRRLNKDKVAKIKLNCYLNNKDHYQQYHKKRYEDNKEIIRGLQAAYYKNNKDSIRLKSKEYYEANKGRFNYWSKKYKLRKIQRTPKWLTKEDFFKMESIYELAQRLSIETSVLHHVDHIIPLKGEFVSGLHTPDNLQVLPWDENLQKSNKFKI